MSNNLSVVIGADTSKFQKAIDDARKKLNQYSTDAKSTAQTVEGTVSVTAEQANAYERVIKALAKVSSGSLNTAQSQKNLSQQIQELKMQWQALSEAQRNSDFGQSLSTTLAAAQSKLSELKDHAKAAGESISNMGGNQEIPLKKQLKMLTTELVNLTNTYRNMTDAERASAEGVALAQKMDEIREKAGTLKDTIGDVSAEISVMASDTPNLDVFNQVLGIGADAMTTYAGIVGKLTGNEAALKDMIATVTMVQGAANLATKVTNALQSSSALMLKLRSIQEKITAVAIQARAAAEANATRGTKAATAAQIAFNLAAKANPYILLATAVVGVGAALYSFCEGAKEAEEMEKRITEAAEKAEEEFKEWTDTVANAGASQMATYNSLQTEWNNLRTEQQKNQFISDNKNKFNDLGFEVDNVADAENFLVKNSDKIIQAMQLRAQAAAHAAEQVRLYGEYLRASEGLQAQFVKAGDISDGKVQNRNDGAEVGQDGHWHFTAEGAEKYNNKLRQSSASAAKLDDIQQKINHHTQEELRLRTEAQNLIKGTGTRTIKRGGGNSGGGHSGSSSSGGGKSDHKKEQTELEALSGSIEDLEEKIAKLNKLRDKGRIKPEDYKKQYEELNKQLEAKKAEYEIKLKIKEGSLEDLNKKIKDAELEIEAGVSEEKKRELLDNIKKWTKEKKQVEIDLMPYGIEKIDAQLSLLEDEVIELQLSVNDADYETKLNEIRAKYKALEDEKFEIQLSLVTGTLGKQKAELERLENLRATISLDDEGAQKQIAELTEQINKKKKEIDETEIKLNIKIPESTEEKIKNAFDGKGLPIEDLEKYIKLLKEQGLTYDEITDKLKEIQELSEGAANFATLSTAISQLGSNISSLGGKAAETIGTIATAVGQTVSLIGQIMAFAAAQAVQNAFALPFPANIPAFASVLGMISTAVGIVGGIVGKFANGGIVGGATTVGDYNLARVNKGEMILNGTQQAHLWNMIKANNSEGSSINSGRVEFKIKGKELVGVLNNYNKQQTRI